MFYSCAAASESKKLPESCWRNWKSRRGNKVPLQVYILCAIPTPAINLFRSVQNRKVCALAIFSNQPVFTVRFPRHFNSIFPLPTFLALHFSFANLTRPKPLTLKQNPTAAATRLKENVMILARVRWSFLSTLVLKKTSKKQPRSDMRRTFLFCSQKGASVWCVAFHTHADKF